MEANQPPVNPAEPALEEATAEPAGEAPPEAKGRRSAVRQFFDDHCPVIFKRLGTQLQLRRGAIAILRPSVYPIFNRALDEGPEASAAELEGMTKQERELYQAFLKLPAGLARESWMKRMIPGLVLPTRARVFRKAIQKGTVRLKPVLPGLTNWLLHDSWRMAIEVAAYLPHMVRVPYELLAPRERLTARLYVKALKYAIQLRRHESLAAERAGTPAHDGGAPAGARKLSELEPRDEDKPPPFIETLTPAERRFAETHRVGGRRFIDLLELYIHGAKENPELYARRSKKLLILAGLLGVKLLLDKLLTQYITTKQSLDDNDRRGMRADDGRVEMIFVSTKQYAYLRFGGDVYKFTVDKPVSLMSLHDFKYRELPSVGNKSGAHIRLELNLTAKEERWLRAICERERTIELVKFFPRGSPVLQVNEAVNRVMGLATLPGINSSYSLTKDAHRVLRARHRRGIGHVIEALPHGGKIQEIARDWGMELADSFIALNGMKRELLVETMRESAKQALAEIEEDDRRRKVGAVPSLPRGTAGKGDPVGIEGLLREVRSPFLPPLPTVNSTPEPAGDKP